MKVTFFGPIQAIHGSLSKDSEYFYRVQNGQTVIVRKPRRDPQRQPTQAVAKAQQRFANLQRMTCEVLRTEALRTHYEQRYRQQKKYTTLHGFILHCLSVEGTK